ncbi:MAG TPA: hypothetical protein DEP05_01570 [Betaproteobacteria bacterium]|nr:hypothetical protein [Betaproteobacteria bacterium]
MPRLLPVIVLLLLSLATAAAHAGIVKWTDAQGNVHYTDQPPSSAVKTEPVAIPNRPAPLGASADKSLAEQEMEFRQRQIKKEEEAAKRRRQQKTAKIRKQNCERSRTNLYTLQSTGRLFHTNAKGERVYLDKAARQTAIEQAKKDIDAWCK